MLDFKLNYYFEMLKDKPFKSSKEFKNEFKKKYGDFKYLSELFVMVNNYQTEKYGCRLCSVYLLDTREERKRKSINSKQRKWYRLSK